MGEGLKRAIAAAKATRVKFVWVAGYGCGCSASSSVKKDLLEYCGLHGSDRRELIKTPIRSNAPSNASS